MDPSTRRAAIRAYKGLAWATTPKGIWGFQRTFFAPKWSDDDSDSGRRRTLRPSFDSRSSNCARFRQNDVNLCQGPRPLCISGQFPQFLYGFLRWTFAILPCFRNPFAAFPHNCTQAAQPGDRHLPCFAAFAVLHQGVQARAFCLGPLCFSMAS